MLQFCTKHDVIRIYHRVILFHALLYCAVDQLVKVSAQYKFVFIYLFIIYHYKLCHNFELKYELEKTSCYLCVRKSEKCLYKND